MFCTNCGKEVSEGSAFCEHCGTPLNAQAQQPQQPQWNQQPQGNTVSQDKVDMFIMTHQKYFPAEKIPVLKERLSAADESKFTLASSTEMKDPTTLLLLSLFLGSLGVDRFMLGDTGMGILKLLTCGVCGVLTIIDWFTVQKRTRELNFNNLIAVL